MSYYTGVAIRFKVMSSAPPEIFTILDSLFNLRHGVMGGKTASQLCIKFIEEMRIPKLARVQQPMAGFRIATLPGKDELEDPFVVLGDLQHILRGRSKHFESWSWAAKEDHQTAIVYESRSGPNSLHPETLLMPFFNALKEFLELEEGDIVCRLLGEDQFVEKVICVRNDKFVIADGTQYAPVIHGVLVDLHDPRLYKRETVIQAETDEFGQTWYRKAFDGDHSVPPWNIVVLEENRPKFVPLSQAIEEAEKKRLERNKGK